MKHFIFAAALFLMHPAVFSQTPVFNPPGYIEYDAGSLPIIISAPHGGSLLPGTLPIRTCNANGDLVTTPDANTQELARLINDSLAVLLGCRAHVIICLLHRQFLDMDRNMSDATCDNPDLTESWQSYHGFIYSAQQKIVEKYGRGLFIDLHGQDHPIKRIEVGYCLNETVISGSDALLNTQQNINKSSIHYLMQNNLTPGMALSDMLRGVNSLGTWLTDAGFDAVPGLQNPTPGLDANGNTNPYKTGGYNSIRWGSRDSGTIDGIQLEVNNALRTNVANRQAFAGQLAGIIKRYITTYIMTAAQLNTCLITLAVPQFENINVIQTGNDVLINWNVRRPKEISSFKIFHSADGVHYTVLDIINASDKTAYTYRDQYLLQEQFFYKVEAINLQGNNEMSEVVVAKKTKESEIKVWPSANNTSLFIRVTSAGNCRGKIKLSDLSGRLVNICEMNAVAGTNVFSIPLSKPLKGIYFVEVSGDDNQPGSKIKILLK